MGSSQKAQKLLETSDTIKHYSTLISYALTYFIAKAEKEGSPFANELRKLEAGYNDEFEHAVEITGEVYSDVFSDEELDELIVLHTNPTLEKLRGLTPEIMNRVLGRFSVSAS